MNAAALTDQLAAFTPLPAAFFAGLSVEDARWRPTESAWSLLEILGHVALEETQDFRPRLAATLAEPMEPWTPIDPEGAVREHACNEGTPAEWLERLARERAESIRWLRSLDSPDWSRSMQYAQLPTLRAGDLLASWVAHDWIHLRQLARRRIELTERDAGSYETAYAGAWS